MSEPIRWGEDDVFDAMLEFDGAAIYPELLRPVVGYRGSITVYADRSHLSLSAVFVTGQDGRFFADPIEAIQYAISLAR